MMMYKALYNEGMQRPRASQAEVEEAWKGKSVQLRRSQLADEGAARLAEQRMQDAQQRAVQQQRERQQRDAALQVQPLLDRKSLLS